MKQSSNIWSRLVFLAAFGLFSTAKASEIFSLENINILQPKVIYGADDRLDLYQVSNPLYRSLADSTAALFNNSRIQIPVDTTANVMIRTSVYGTSMSLCKDEPFYNQPIGAFCSGSLVGPDLMMTAGHCIRSQFSCEDTTFVFGYAVNNTESFPNEVPNDNIYRCKKVVSTFVNNTGADYAIVKLDRVVNNRAPLKINRLGDAAPATPIVVIGHPSGLPTKVSAGANVRKVNNGYFVANLDTYGGNSGSAVFNADTGLVEGILVRGENDFITRPGGCRASNYCTDDGCRGEDVTTISSLAHLIPEM